MSASKRTRPSDPSLLVGCLLALAVIVLMLGLGAGLMAMLSLSHVDWPPETQAIVSLVICLVAGCTLATLLWAVAWLCRAQHARNLTQEGILTLQAHAAESPAVMILPESSPDTQAEPAVPPPPAFVPAAPAPPGADAKLQQAILEQLKELNASVLLSDAQRQSKREQLVRLELQRLTAQVERAMAEGRWPQAEESLEKMVRVAPEAPQTGELRRRLEQSRSQAQVRDQELAEKQAQDFMAAGQFAQARAVSERLLERYPASPQAIALLSRVDREREALVNEQRMRMYKKVELEAANRRWRSAAVAAQELLAAHPRSPQAEAVRAKLPTLRDNALLEEVREIRNQIRDLISRRRYPEALEVARDLVHRFPQTAVAEELRSQMARLEELAKSKGNENA